MADKTDKEDLVPIPDEAYTNNYDGRVYIKNTDIEGENRTIIGWRDPESGMMRPNAAYEEYFEADYQQYFPHRKVYPKVLHIGLYMIFLAIACKLGLYCLWRSQRKRYHGLRYLLHCVQQQYSRKVRGYHA